VAGGVRGGASTLPAFKTVIGAGVCGRRAYDRGGHHAASAKQFVPHDPSISLGAPALRTPISSPTEATVAIAISFKAAKCLRSSCQQRIGRSLYRSAVRAVAIGVDSAARTVAQLLIMPRAPQGQRISRRITRAAKTGGPSCGLPPKPGTIKRNFLSRSSLRVRIPEREVAAGRSQRYGSQLHRHSFFAATLWR